MSRITDLIGAEIQPNKRTCGICGNPAADEIRYCSDCRKHMDYCHEKCDPSGKNGSWDDCDQCTKCEHNMHYVHGKSGGSL